MSIRKISKDLGLSSATISWILSGQGEKRGFKKETIQRVTQYAQSINYKPNILARNLSKGSTKTLGVIIPHINDSYYAAITQEIESQAHLKSYGLTICSSSGNPQREQELIEILLSQQVDGIILATATDADPSIQRLNEKECPFVLIDRRSTTQQTNYVGPNNFQCSYELTTRMIDQGAKKIALITSDTHLSAMQDRTEGYKLGLSKKGIEFQESLVVDIERPNYTQAIPEMIEALLNTHPDLDGIFFATHYLALHTFKHFTEKGIDFNSRFKMASIHNACWFKIIAPQINIAAVPIKDISKEAVEILCNKITNKEVPLRQIILENTII